MTFFLSSQSRIPLVFLLFSPYLCCLLYVFVGSETTLWDAALTVSVSTQTRLPTISIHTLCQHFPSLIAGVIWEKLLLSRKPERWEKPFCMSTFKSFHVAATLWDIQLSLWSLMPMQQVTQSLYFFCHRTTNGRIGLSRHACHFLPLYLWFCRYRRTSISQSKHIHSEIVITIILPSLARRGQSVSGQRSPIALCVAASSIHNLAFRCLIDCHW